MSRTTKKNLLATLIITVVLFFLSSVIALGGINVKADAVSKGRIDVYLIGGQSNAVGYGEDTGNALVNEDSRYANGFENVLYYGAQERVGASVTEGFQPVKIGLGRTEVTAGAEIGIASALKDTNGMKAIIKCAWGATHIYPDSTYDISLTQGTWTSPSYIAENNVDTSANPKIGRMYTWFLQTVTDGIALLEAEGYEPVIKGMWWMQGEAEMFTEAMSSKYDELITALIKDVRNDVSRITRSDYSEMPFVFGLPSWNKSVSGSPAYENAVRDNMQAVANDENIVNVASVDCANLVQHDMWHFDANSQKYLGEQFISALSTLTEGENESFNESISLYQGASIRTNEPIGIRFAAKITDYNEENGYKYGMVIIPTDYLETYSSEIEEADYNYVKAFTDNDIDVANMTCYVVNDSETGVNYIQGSLVSIKYKNLNREFTGIGYIYDQVNDKYLYTSATESRSVSYIASAAIFDYSETDTVYAGIKNYLNGAINQKNGVAEENGYDEAIFDINVPESIQLEYGGAMVTSNLNVTQVPELGFKVKYSSKNPLIATVDENGVVSPIGLGTTEITVKCLDVEKTVNVVVDYPVIDGIKLDGVRDEKYGDFTDTVLLDGGRYYNISGVKTENGVFVFSQALFDTASIAATWGSSNNFEFKLNKTSNQNYVALGNKAFGVTQYKIGVEEYNGKYLHTVEFYADKSIINNWNDNEDVQLNYAWGTINENAIMLSSMMDYRHMDWNTYWHSYQTLGGLSTHFAEMPSNLFIGKDGLTPLTGDNGMTVDGELSEYGELVRTASNTNSSASVNAKLVGGDLYIGLSFTHNQWTSYTTVVGNWHTNDNIEFRLSGDDNVRQIIMFNDGNILYPSYFTYAASKTVEQGGKLVTTVELYKKDVTKFQFRLGMNGTNLGWLGVVWNNGFEYVTEDGIVSQRPTTFSNGVTLDGNFNESLWSENVKANSENEKAFGADVTLFGRKLDTGLLLGTQIKHNKAPGESINGLTNWWNYLNIEYHFNGDATQYIATALNARSNEKVFSASKTVENESGDYKYTTNIEVFITYEDLGLKKDQRINMSFGGWFEQDFKWLFGGNATTLMTHVITEDGIFDKDHIEDDMLKILTIGNSFSDDTMEYMYQIATSLGVKCVLGNLYIGGCDIDTHLNNLNNNLGAYDYRTYVNGGWKTTANYKMQDAILSENWDYISFQQASGKSGVESTYANLNSLVEGVKLIANKNAKIVWNMTWAYQSDSTHGDFPTYDRNQMTMYNAIVNAVQSQIETNERFEIISPTGTAIQNARATILGDTLTRDGYHLELNYGRYIAGLTFFYAITGIDISNIEFAPNDVSNEVKALCIQSAIDAVNTPYSVTING